MFLVKNERGETVERFALLSDAAKTALKLQNQTRKLHFIERDKTVRVACGGMSFCESVGTALLATFGGA